MYGKLAVRGGVVDDQGASTIRLSLLRRFDVQIGQHSIRLSSSAQRLVAFLALRDTPVGRLYVAGMLWPETTTERASANLRSSLWRVQRSCKQLIAVSADHLGLATWVAVDVRAVGAYARQLIGPSSTTRDLGIDDMRSHLNYDLLPDWYDDWVLVEQERYNQLRLHAIDALCLHLTAVGHHAEAIDAGLAAVRAEPLRESAHRALIQAHLAEGNRWEAVRQYERCRRLLLDELGLEPSAAMRALLPALPALTDPVSVNVPRSSSR
jgi:DNA-binding SARP family transcriptional activator